MVNFVRSPTPPPCLALTKKYDCEGVLTQLKLDFKNKCYLCEQKAPISINIEHFKPHKGDEILKLDWKNLFFVCAHCNNCKLAIKMFDDILDCTDTTIQIVDRIQFEMKPYPKESVKITTKAEDATTQNTVALLLRVYNGEHRENKKISTENLRNLLLKELESFSALLKDYYDEDIEVADKQNTKRLIEKSLSNASPFTAFKIWIVKENAHLQNEFGRFLQKL